MKRLLTPKLIFGLVMVGLLASALAVSLFLGSPARSHAASNNSPEGSWLLLDERRHREDCERMAAKHEEVFESVPSHVRRQIPRDQRIGHGLGMRDASLEQLAHERGGTKHAMGHAERKPGRIPVQRLHVVGRDVVEGDRIDENEPINALRSGGREVEGDSPAEVHADNGRLRKAQGCQGAVEVVALGRDPEWRVERAIRLAVAEHVDRERSPVGNRDLRPDVAPEKGAGPETVHEHDGSAAVAIAFDVHRPGTNGDAKQVCVDGVLLWGSSEPRAGGVLFAFRATGLAFSEHGGNRSR